MNLEQGYDMVLYTAPLEDGLQANMYIEALNKMRTTESGYVVMDFAANNTSAYGFITADAFEQINYDKAVIEAEVNKILDDMTLESLNNEYIFGSIRAYIQ